MFTKTSDLFTFIGLSVLGSVALLMLTCFLGEVHGLMVAVIILFGQSAQSFVRITTLQRELTSLRQVRGDTSGKVAGKI